MDWRDELALKSPRAADYAWTVLAAILAWAKDRGKISVNPCERGGRVYHGTRVDKVWSIEDEEAFLRSAAPHLHLALLLALWTGQRQGDLLRLPWSAYDGKVIRLRQSKSIRKGGRGPVNVTIPVGAPLKEALDAAAKHKRSTIILTTMDDTPWTSDGFRASWGKACARAGVVGVTFNDLRFTWDCRNPARARRLHRGRDRVHHGPQSARRTFDLGCALPAPRSRAGAGSNPQARIRVCEARP
jgi:integrase